MRPSIESISPAEDAQLTYRLRLETMTDGQLQRERLRLKTRPNDSWEMAAWRIEHGRRVAPAWS